VVYCEECEFLELVATCVVFESHVTFLNCQFTKLDFYGAYFLSGLTFRGCTVKKSLSFQSGGHNNERAFSIFDSNFESFVDFEDCWFTGPLHVENVVFAAGTNLLGNNNTPMEVEFKTTPVFTNVTGKLDTDTYFP